MTPSVRIDLLPLNQTLHVRRGTALQDVLFAQGVEFPCGGQGRCKGCRIKVLAGTLPVCEEEKGQLTATELAEGWRLACQARAEGDLKLELAQWEAPILTDDTPFTFTPQDGLGIAIDLGTTTVVAQLLDLRTGQVLAVRAALNAQARHGADIMSRIEFALTGSGRKKIEKLIRHQIGRLIEELLTAIPEVCPSLSAAISAANPASNQFIAPASSKLAAPGDGRTLLRRIVLVGNTVMHHLFCGLSIEPLAQHPFEPVAPGLQVFTAADLGWSLPGKPEVFFLPCLGGFVGSDILAGILATKLHESAAPAALIDLGTNGEIVVGDRTRLLCASTAAGPAFEGARISMGMRAASGAIAEVRVEQGGVRCHVLGNRAPRGICGSGLVDAVAAGLELGWIAANGRLVGRESLTLVAPVSLNQRDVRELQLAKGAIAAGLSLLTEQWGARESDLTRIYLAGAFGNYINYASARRIGLLNFPAEKVQPVGNAALLGAKLTLCGGWERDGASAAILAKTRHVSLNEDARFQETFAEAMGFPSK